jgi:lysophospholipase L1-like esterase
LPLFERYVAMGDSTAEGLDDPDGQGGYRGWADRLAERLASVQGTVLYANLAVRGRTTRQVLEEQLGPALAMKPDLALVVAGTNDLLRARFDAGAVGRDMETMQTALVRQGATVVSFTLPDLGPVIPLARPLRSRVQRLARVLSEASARSGAILVDFTAHPFASDPRLWSEDRLHANALGHARIAEALAHALCIPGSSADWTIPLPAAPSRAFRARLRAELDWTRRFLLPWLSRHARGRSSGDGRFAKRPELRLVEAGARSVIE